jgi:iron complex transport system ATP-binding protein
VVISGFHSSIGVHGTLADRVDNRQIAAARATLDDLGIGALARTALRSMSTGQQRRCILARALVHKPQTLILDEPTAGLDFAASFDYLARIRRLSDAGRNILVVTHHLNEIPPGIDRVVLLQNGQIAVDGQKNEVLTDDILSEVYEVPIRVTEINGYYLAYPGESAKT